MTAPAHRSRTPSPELGLTIAFALAFAVWTWLVLRGSLHDLDVGHGGGRTGHEDDRLPQRLPAAVPVLPQPGHLPHAGRRAGDRGRAAAAHEALPRRVPHLNDQ